MGAYLKYKPVWLQLVIFGSLTFGIFLVVSLLGTLLLGRAYGMNIFDLNDALMKADFTDPNMVRVIQWMLVIQFFSLFLIPSLLFAYLSDPRPMVYAGFKKPHKAYYFILAILVMTAGFFFIAWIGEWNKQIKLPAALQGFENWARKAEAQTNKQLSAMMDMKSVKDLLINLLLVGVFAGVGEELFFRGILQRLFIRLFKSPWTGIFITAAIFSAIHMQFLGFFPRLALGMALGALYWYSGSLWPAIVAHFIFNATQVVLIYTGVMKTDDNAATGNTLTFIGIAGLALMLTVIYIMVKKSPTRYAQVYEADAPPAGNQNYL